MVGPPLKRGIKLIKAVYPKAESATLNPHALEALIKYILTNPHKLSDIAKYIEKRVKKDIAKSRYGFLQISLEVVNNVLRTCHSNLLTLYAPNVVNVLQEIFLLDRNLNTKSATPGSPLSAVVNNIYKMKMLAVETFEQFAKSRQNNNVAEYQDLGFFVDYFVDMAANNSDTDLRKKMRLHGMRALHVYITTVEDLDSFVNRYIESKDKNNKIVLSTILTNMLDYKDEKPAETKVDEIDSNNVYALCVACLRELTRSASAITIQALLTAVLEFLDEKKVWTTQGFAKDCMKAISQKPQTTSITFPILVRHVESVKDSATKIAVVETIIFLAEGSAKGSIGSLIELIFHLVSQLMTSSGVEEQDEGLQRAIVNCIGVVSKIAEVNEKIAAMKQLLDKIKAEKEERISTALLECMAQIAMNFKELQPAKSIELVEPLIGLPVSKHPEHRSAILKIFQFLLNVPSRRGSISFNLFKSTDGSEEKKLEKRNDMIRVWTFQQLQLEDNEPNNYEAIFKIFSLLVQISRGKELERSLPMLLKVEGILTSKYSAVPHVMRSIHSVVAAYLLFISKVFGAVELEEYVTKIMTDAWTPVLVWEGEQLVAKKLKFKKKYKKVDPVTTTFDHDMVIQLVSKSQQITSEFGSKDIQQVFSHEKIASAATILETQPSSSSLPPQERVLPIIQIPATSQAEVTKKEQFKFSDLKSIFDEEKDAKKEKSIEAKPVAKALSYHTTVALSTDQDKKTKELNELLELMIPDEPVSLKPTMHSSSCTVTMKFPQLLHDLTNLHLNKQFTVC